MKRPVYERLNNPDPKHIAKDFYIGATHIIICDDCCVSDPKPILDEIMRIGRRALGRVENAE